jgi:stress-induced morphogen
MTEKDAKSLAKALRKKFGGRVEYEDVTGKGRFRFAIETKRFNGVPHLKRQDDVWDIVDDVLSREATLDISTILAYAPADLALSE